MYFVLQSYEHYERVKREREQQGLPPPPPPTNGPRTPAPPAIQPALLDAACSSVNVLLTTSCRGGRTDVPALDSY